MAKVTFVGASYTIYVSTGVTDLDAQIDLYSDWKEWASLSDNLKYYPAFDDSVGNNPIGGARFVGDYYFLNNDYWKIQPYDGNHTLTIDGNLYPINTSAAMFLPVSGKTVTIQLERSQLTQIAAVSTGSGLNATQNLQLSELWKFRGLDATDPMVFTPTKQHSVSSAIVVNHTGDPDTSITATRE